MHILLKRKIFRHSKRTSGCQDTLYDRIVREIKEHTNTLYNTGFLKGTSEILRNVILNAHCGKYNRKVLSLAVGNLSLLYYLHRQLVMRQTGA